MDTIVAAAIRHREVWDQIGKIVQSPRLTANPYHRLITTFAGEFVQRYDKLPQGDDWTIWFQTLSEGMQRDGCRETWGRLMVMSLPPTPEFLGDAVRTELRQSGGRIIMAALAVTNGTTSPAAIRQMAEEVEGLLVGPADLEAQWPTLATLAEDPNLMREPDELLANLVWRGWWTVLAAAAFTGKSTLATQGAAALTRARPFLGGRHIGPGRVLYCNVGDESLGLTVRRLTGYGADRYRTQVFDFRKASGVDLLTSMQGAIAAHTPDVVVIDSLIAWARRVVKKEMPASGDAAGWAEVTRPLGALAHEHDVGLLVLHHATKDGQRYRDSTEIAAAADVLVEMTTVRGADPCQRRFVSVSRLTGRSTWRASYREGAYELTAEEEGRSSPEVQTPADRVAPLILQFVEAHPGGSKNQIMRGIAGDDRVKTAALHLLADGGAVRIEEPQGRGKPRGVWAVDTREKPG
jgi:hypothetical protein